MAELKVGDVAPDFTFVTTLGEKMTLSEVTKQNNVVLYFYPRDFTPGCTQEACDFRDNWSAVQKAGAVVLGVSTDSDASHKKFVEKLRLPFTLVPDESKEIVQKYGVFSEKKFMGRTFQGTCRTTFVIGKDRKIQKIFRSVKVLGHVKNILDILRNKEGM